MSVIAGDTVTKALRAFTANGHGEGGVLVDYAAFWRWLSGLSVQERQSRHRGEVVAFTNVFEENGVWFMRVLQGREGDLPLYLNTATGDEREGEVGRNEVLAGAAVFAFDPSTRFLAVERGRPAVNVAEVARALSRIGRDRGFDARLTFSFTPVVRAEGFEEELSSFEVIKEVDVVVARPNTDWDDNATFLTTLAAESNASRAELSMVANRGESLSRDTGIVQQIRDLVGDGRTPIEDVVVRGRVAGQEKDTRARMGRFVETGSVQVSRTIMQGRVEAVRTGLRAFLDRLRERYGVDDDA